MHFIPTVIQIIHLFLDQISILCSLLFSRDFDLFKPETSYLKDSLFAPNVLQF